ncbi:Calcium-dependent protein kinase 14, variant 2 [Trifolium repens]|nr:Calcium-dependent protein kinase 14, variant 2 [Trifolium repens]
MENCCANLCGVFKKQKQKQKPRPNKCSNKLVVLKEPTGREIRLRYELGRELRRSEFGITYLCKDRQTGEELACKSISKNELRTAIDIEDVRREVEIMRHLPKHPNIVSLKYTYEDDDDVHLLMEHCEGGGESGDDLLDRIVSRGGYNESSAASIIKTIVHAVQMCHKHGVMHRNLKTENFLCANRKETAYLKLTDFRSSIFFKPGERLNQIVGNLYYMAPEVLQRNYGPEIDIWSAGVILYILLCGFPPFWAEAEQEVAKAITKSIVDFERNPWPMVSDNAKDLVKKMLDPDPKLRLTAQEVLGHPWLLNPKTAPNVSLGDTVRGKLLQFSIMKQLTITTSMVIAEHLSREEFWVRDTGITGYTNCWCTKFQLNYEEFLAFSHHLRKRSHEEFVDSAFQFFDKKQSGYIELEELHKALAAETESHCKEVIKAIMHDVATDEDGKISYEEITNRSLKLMREWLSSEIECIYDEDVVSKFLFGSL